MPPRESALCSSGTACARRFARPTWAAIRSAACAPAPRIPLISLALALLRQGAKNLSDRNAHIRALNAQLRTGLEELAQQAPIALNSPTDAVPEVLNFSTNCVNSQTFIEYLSGRHIYISGGSACDKGEPSHTLMAMGAPDLAVRTALRVSFCGDNTPEDVQALLDGLKDGLKELQHI